MTPPARTTIIVNHLLARGPKIPVSYVTSVNSHTAADGQNVYPHFLDISKDTCFSVDFIYKSDTPASPKVGERIAEKRFRSLPELRFNYSTLLR